MLADLCLHPPIVLSKDFVVTPPPPPSSSSSSPNNAPLSTLHRQSPPHAAAAASWGLPFHHDDDDDSTTASQMDGFVLSPGPGRPSCRDDMGQTLELIRNVFCSPEQEGTFLHSMQRKLFWRCARRQCPVRFRMQQSSLAISVGRRVPHGIARVRHVQMGGVFSKRYGSSAFSGPQDNSTSTLRKDREEVDDDKKKKKESAFGPSHPDDGRPCCLRRCHRLASDVETKFHPSHVWHVDRRLSPALIFTASLRTTESRTGGQRC